MSAVIDRKAFDRIKGYIDTAKNSSSTKVVAGGICDDSQGYFISPTVIETKDPTVPSMKEVS